MKLTAAIAAALLAAQAPALLRDSPGIPNPTIERRAEPLAWSQAWDPISESLLSNMLAERRTTRAATSPTAALAWTPAAPTAADFKRRITPALEKALATSQNELKAAALLALARLGPMSGLANLRERFTPLLRSVHPILSEAAALALGELGEDAGLEPLLALLVDSSEGRKLTRSPMSAVPDPLRIAAATALGVYAQRNPNPSDRRRILAELEAVFELESMSAKSAPGSKPLGLATTCLGAIGSLAFEDDAATRQTIMLLLAVFQDGEQSAELRIESSIAACRQLVRLRDARETEAAIEVFLNEIKRAVGGTDAAAWKASVAALGELLGTVEATKLDAKVRARLLALGTLQRDPEVRLLGLVALGKIAGRTDATGTADEKAVHEVTDELARLLESNRETERDWAALAAGLMLHGLQDAEFAGLAAKSVDKLVRTLEVQLEAATAQFTGPLSVAAGLSGRREFGPLLVKKFATVEDDEAAGYIGQALGMLDFEPARAALQETYAASKYRSIKVQLLTPALALTPDSRTLDTLLGALDWMALFRLRGSLAHAIATLSDRRAIGPLIQLALDDTQATTYRVTAIETLGRLAHPER